MSQLVLIIKKHKYILVHKNFPQNAVMPLSLNESKDHIRSQTFAIDQIVQQTIGSYRNS